MRLVTILGVKTWEADYALSGKTCRAPLASVAIVKLRGGISQVVSLCTQRAEQETLPILRQSIPVDTAVVCERIPSGKSPDEVQEFVSVVARVLDGKDAILDMTHGYRHLPLLAFAVVLYLSALQRTRLEAAYYGLLDDRGHCPLLDLKPLVELATLAFAAGELRRTGSTTALVERVCRDGGTDANMLAVTLDALSAAFASGLPLELGHEAARFQQEVANRLERWLRRRGVPLADGLVSAIKQTIARPAFVAAGGSDWKRGVMLTADELERQARLVDDLLERRAYGPAAMVMEEWALSWAISRLFRPEGAGDWLDRANRERAAAVLRALVAWDSEPMLKVRLTQEQQRLAGWWQALSELRNSLAHAGMRREEVTPWRKKSKLGRRLECVRNGWQWLRTQPDVSLRVPGIVRRLLVTPVGNVPGAFFSALYHAWPVDRCLSVCSPSSRPLVDQVLARFGQGLKVLFCELSDPYADEVRARKVATCARPILAEAEEVVLNLTGGTTLMGLVVEWLGQEAKRLGRRVRRLVVLDKRPREEQEHNSYVKGQAVWLEDEGA